jgi:succinyl-CoA synthetase beta subunit
MPTILHEISPSRHQNEPKPEIPPMKIHEYQGKEILRQFGVPVPRGIAAFTVQEAIEAAQKLGGPVWVVKAQIHAGGRGKGGGVKVAKSIEDVKARATDILGMQLVTHQTGPAGQKVRRLYIEDGADIQQEYYLSIVTDRATQKVAFIASSEGGMDIEKVAHDTPEKILTVFVDPLSGLTDAQCLEIGKGIQMPADSQAQFADVCKKLYKCYMDTDASLVEINPLNRDGKGNIIALDSKFNFDANALFRHPEIVALRDLDEEDAAEVEASKFDLAYISLDGNIGCLVNGAGLAMATMDTIKLYGAEPANFLDVGGGATPEKVTEAFKIMLKNPKVEAILVNIFGGIMKCDTIATGIITACKATNLNVPLVVRMKGTNEELGKKMLAESGLPIISADTMAEAAEKVVGAVKAREASAGGLAAAGAGLAAVGVAGSAMAAKAVSAVGAGAASASAGLQNAGNTAAAAISSAGASVTGAAAGAVSGVASTVAGGAAAAAAATGAIANQAKGGIPWWLWAIGAAVIGFFLLKSCGGKTESSQASSASVTPAPASVATAPVATPAATPPAAAASVAAPAASEAAMAKPIEAAAVGADVCTQKQVATGVEFETGKSVIKASSQANLKTLADQLAKCGAIKGEIAGHTDNVGNPQANQKLSQERATAVKDALVKLGVSADRLSATGYGDSKPVADNTSAENRQKNRRVEFVAQ